VVAPAQADVGANGAEYAAEGVGPLPGRRERADGAAAGAADAAVVAVVRQANRPAIRRGLLFYFGQQLIQQEADVIVTEAVVLEAAVEAVQGLGRRRLDAPVHYEDANDDRHLLLVDEIIEDRRGIELDAVLVHPEAGRAGGVV